MFLGFWGCFWGFLKGCLGILECFFGFLIECLGVSWGVCLGFPWSFLWCCSLAEGKGGLEW